MLFLKCVNYLIEKKILKIEFSLCFGFVKEAKNKVYTSIEYPSY